MNINLLREKNFEVTNKYIDIIAISLKSALEEKNNDVKIVEFNTLKDLKKVGKKEIIIVSTAIEGIKLILSGYRNIIIWFQGVAPEESYMKNKSKIRKYILSTIEKMCIKKSKFRIFVSNEQIKHYENKYNIKIKDRYFVMPCFNAKYNKKSFEIKNKYRNNKFCYVGSTAKWQQFDEIALLYKQIEEKTKNSEFMVLTRNITEAQSVITKLGIKNYHINHVKPEQVEKEIEKCKYGFILREDCVVNRVATPTKLGNYMSCGVIPIFSKCLVSFSNATKDIENVICIDNMNIAAEKIIEHSKKNIDVKKITEEYAEIFNKYYNFEYYKKKLKQIFKNLF